MAGMSGVAVGFDYPAIERLALARGCPDIVCAHLFPVAESAALAAIHEALKDDTHGRG